MIAVEDTVLVLLAAGRSERFGDIGSKLDQPFLARPLGLHVAVALEDMPFRQRIVVVDGCTIDFAQFGFFVTHNDDPERDMASSVRIGVECARAHDAKAVLIALADMPRVTAAHIHRLFDASEMGERAVVASSDGRSPKPPALFGRARFDELLAISGDQGARDLIQSGRHVVTNGAELIDVDTPEELEALRELVHAPEALSRPDSHVLRGGDAEALAALRAELKAILGE
ncbi:nucleotidyltransferase family protein [Sphingomonas yunnanensis]|uniref:nucleotidyltransferase family protein n=1 Tax=Sphingomonas yunnanensis TaxID=310400 RepID=UPI001CA6FCA5|nr:nucleotidyltransferase family protein [Sphingomonas yunnanensis]MBY9063946.1 nucleotidyltransferase family protein [Sphingomonas yunnanensis]